MPRDGRAHGGLGPFASINKIKTMPSPRAHRPVWWKQYLSWGSFTLLRCVKLRNEVTFDSLQAWLLSLFTSTNAKKSNALTLLWVTLHSYSKWTLIHASISRPSLEILYASWVNSLIYQTGFAWNHSFGLLLPSLSEANRHRHRHRHKRCRVLRKSQSLTGSMDPSTRSAGFQAGSPVQYLGTPKGWMVGSGVTAKTELSAPIPVVVFFQVSDISVSLICWGFSMHTLLFKKCF